MTSSNESLWTRLEADSDGPAVQRQIGEAIRNGAIRVVPAPNGRIRIIPLKNWPTKKAEPDTSPPGASGSARLTRSEG